jgi:hypothetical protein
MRAVTRRLAAVLVIAGVFGSAVAGPAGAAVPRGFFGVMADGRCSPAGSTSRPSSG